MRSVLSAEYEVAECISRQFQQIANDARSGAEDVQQAQAVRHALTDFGASLVADRQKLIKQEIALYDIA